MLSGVGAHLFIPRNSYLYKTHEHGDAIVGNAVIVKRNEESLEMLTGLEAVNLAQEMTQQHGHAVETIISKALQIPPMPAPKRESSLMSDIWTGFLQCVSVPSARPYKPCEEADIEKRILKHILTVSLRMCRRFWRSSSSAIRLTP